MKGYRIPDLRLAAQTGAAWLFALGLGIALTPSIGTPGIIQKYVVAVVLIAGAVYLFRAGQAVRDTNIGSLAREAVRLSERGRKAA